MVLAMIEVALGAAAAVLIAVSGMALLRRQLTLLQPEVSPPALVAMVVGGVAFGFGLLYASPEAAAFRPAAMFDSRGPWMIGLVELLARHGAPGFAALRDLAGAAAWPDSRAGLYAWIGLAGVAALLWPALRVQDGAARRRCVIVGALTVMLLALYVHLMAQLAAWLAAQLGFWLLGLALLLLQRLRYRYRYPC